MRALSAGAKASACVSLVVVRASWAHGELGSIPQASVPWSFDAWVVVPLLASALLFACGWWQLRARARDPSKGLRARGWAFSTGWLIVAAALVSPLHAAGERSFAAHMLEHELLMLAGAPLLVIAAPLGVMLWALPPRWRSQMGRLLNSRSAIASLWSRATRPLVATALQAAALWLWHAPALFDLALVHRGWHVVQHACFLGSALLFWTTMLRRAPRTNRGTAALCLFATSVISGALGALMAFSQSPWYQGYAQMAAAPLGLTPAEDQQIAGLLMWIPGGLVHAVVALLLIRTLLISRDPPRRAVDAT